MTAIPGMHADDILNEIIEAHGGRALWRRHAWIEAELSADGFLFTAKHVSPLRHVRVSASTREPRFIFHDFPKPGQRAELIGTREVRITEAGGSILASRTDPRQAFSRPGRLIRWDMLDFIYFAGYATWNYLTTPFLFLQEGFRCELLDQNRAQDRMTTLRVTFPDSVPTHSPQQIYFFDEARLLRRLDYTAEVVGGWAHAAHFCDDYRVFSGLKVPTRRRVRPKLLSRVLPGPTLVAIDIHDVRLIP